MLKFKNRSIKYLFYFIKIEKPWARVEFFCLKILRIENLRKSKYEIEKSISNNLWKLRFFLTSHTCGAVKPPWKAWVEKSKTDFYILYYQSILSKTNSHQFIDTQRTVNIFPWICLCSEGESLPSTCFAFDIVFFSFDILIRVITIKNAKS